VQGAQVTFNLNNVPTTFVNAGQLTASIPASAIAIAGNPPVIVNNPDGFASTPLTFTIRDPQPAVTSFSPAGATAGGPSFTLTVNGAGFVQGAQITFNSNSLPTTFVGASQLTANIPASAIAVAGNPPVIVNNLDGIVSTPLSFTISNPQAGVGSVTPTSLPVGSNELTLIVTGTGFLSVTPGGVGSQVFINGNPRQTIVKKQTELWATLLPADLSQPGTLIITVVNPLTAGGTAPVVQFAVTDFSVVPPASIPPINAGQTASILLTVSPMSGFNSPVDLSASNLPPDAVFSFMPSASITSLSAPQTVTLSISTMPHTSGGIVRLPNGFLPPALLLCLLVTTVLLAGFCLWLDPQQQMRFLPQLILALVLSVIAGLAACGAVGSAPTSAPGSSTQPINTATGTPAGNYTIDVQAASSGGVSHTTTVMLTIK